MFIYTIYTYKIRGFCENIVENDKWYCHDFYLNYCCVCIVVNKIMASIIYLILCLIQKYLILK